MVRMVSLFASNFKKLNFDSPIIFKTGVTVVSGLNEAGKSTILDAMLYALFGRVTRPPGHVKDEDLLAYQSKKGTVILEFEIGGEHYRLKREILRVGTNKADLHKRAGDGWKAVAVKSRDVTGAVESLLGGISFEEMLSSNVVAQKDLGRLVDPKSDRWKVVNAFLHLESFTEASRELNDEKNELEGTGPLRPGSVRTAREKLGNLKEVQTQYNERKEKNLKLNEEIVNLTRTNDGLTNKRNELEARESRLVEYQETLQSKERLSTEADAQQRLLDHHRKTVSDLEPKVHDAEGALVKFKGLPSEQEVQPVAQLAETVKLEGVRLRQVANQITSEEKEVRRAEEELKPFNPESLATVKRSRSMKGPAIGLGASAASAAVTFALTIPIIPWVLSAAAAVFAILLVARVRAMSQLVKLDVLAAKYRALEKDRKELIAKKEQHSAALRTQAGAEGKLTRMIQAIECYKGLDGEEGLVARAERIARQHAIDLKAREGAEGELNRLTTSLTTLRGQLDEAAMLKKIEGLRSQASALVLPALPDGLVFSKQVLASTVQAKESAATGIASNSATIASDRRTIEENEAFLKENSGIDSQVSFQEDLVRKLERQLTITKLAKEGIEKTAEVIKARFRPGVARHMGEILPSLTMGRYKAALLDEDFGVKVFDPDAGEYRPRDVFSGGTDDQFLLAMRLAFVLSLLPESKGTRPDFLWLDEPLGSSDELRRSGIVEYLSSGLTKSFGQIFIVSHVGGLEEMVSTVVRLENGKPLS